MSEDDSPRTASEVFDLSHGMDFESGPDEVSAFARDLEQAEAFDAEAASDETLAEFVAALKTLEKAAEDARKEVFEAELDERTDVGDEIGPVRKQTGHRKFVIDDDAALDAVEEAGGDLREVVSVKPSALVDAAEELGIDPDEHVDRNEYEYFRRRS